MGCARISSDFYIRWHTGQTSGQANGQANGQADGWRTMGGPAASGEQTGSGQANSQTSGLTLEHIDWCFESMRFYGFDATVFYDGPGLLTLEDWREFATDPGRMFFCLFASNGTQIAAFWIDRPSATLRQSYIHFTLLVPPASVDYVRAFRQGARWVFANTRVRQLVGLTPVCYRHALQVMRAVGFTALARLRGAVRVRGKERDAVLSLLSQGDM